MAASRMKSTVDTPRCLLYIIKGLVKGFRKAAILTMEAADIVALDRAPQPKPIDLRKNMA